MIEVGRGSRRVRPGEVEGLLVAEAPLYRKRGNSSLAIGVDLRDQNSRAVIRSIHAIVADDGKAGCVGELERLSDFPRPGDEMILAPSQPSE